MGDFSFGGKYRLFDEEKEPFLLVAGLDIKFDTAGGGNAGTQTTDVSQSNCIIFKNVSSE
ncbi:hypothetical protein [Geotalea uraniireducens]|uniref:Uncharacterized protein n=1 Tax=Geotalea uraniireducens (strain Rf4) TaxID=351605 RepID=A5G7M1_GEOUR|nr:hypothetical protein [Geotalea uraniireducens]ABQ27789.1 hypothetical protein Gura_3635 [Geotalea uraniireducens Rf4]